MIINPLTEEIRTVSNKLVVSKNILIENNSILFDKVEPDDKYNLLYRYLKSSYINPMDLPYREIVGELKRVRLFRRYSFNSLIQDFTLDFLEVDKPYYKRRYEFEIYFYRQMVSHKYWNDLNFINGYCKIKRGDYYIVLKEEWFNH